MPAQVVLDSSDKTAQTKAVRVCVIFNPTAKGDKARRFLRHLDDLPGECARKQTASRGDARRLAAEAVREGFDVVVAAGGDGTMNEVLNGIGDVPDGFERARLAILPLGTVNVFARELNLPIRLERAWHTIRQGRETAIDLMRVECQENGAATKRYFAQLAGAGLDARAIELVDWSLKKKIGPLAYVVAGLKALCRAQSTIRVNAAGRTTAGALVLVGNGRLYGGPFAIFPEADLRDGLMDVRVFPRVGWSTLFRCAPGVLLRRRLSASAAEQFHAASLELTSAAAVAVQLDGECVGHLPATFSVERGRLRVIVP